MFRERLKKVSIMKNFEVKELLKDLPIVNYHAAGIDVGNKEMWVTYTNPEGSEAIQKTKQSQPRPVVIATERYEATQK